MSLSAISGRFEIAVAERADAALERAVHRLIRHGSAERVWGLHWWSAHSTWRSRAGHGRRADIATAPQRRERALSPRRKLLLWRRM